MDKSVQNEVVRRFTSCRLDWMLRGQVEGMGDRWQGILLRSFCVHVKTTVASPVVDVRLWSTWAAVACSRDLEFCVCNVHWPSG